MLRSAGVEGAEDDEGIRPDDVPILWRYGFFFGVGEEGLGDDVSREG